MPFNSEREFEDALAAKLTQLDNQWSREILSYPTEQDLVDNWAKILFSNNNETDKLNNCPLTESEMQQIISQINGESPFAINRRLNARYISIIRDNPKDTLHNGKRVDLFLFDKDEIAAGRSVYQIARQPKLQIPSEILGDRRADLMLLINGMPLYHTAEEMILIIRRVFDFGAVFVDTPDIQRVINNRKVTDHHAIIPTAEIGKQDLSKLSKEEMDVLKLISQQMLCATGARHEYLETEVTVTCAGHEFKAKGKTVLVEGRKAVEAAYKGSFKAKDKEKEERVLPTVKEGSVFHPAASISEHFYLPAKGLQ